MIKFQYTNIQMALDIARKSEEFMYLFDSDIYEQFNPEKVSITRDLEQEIEKRKNYFDKVNKKINDKEVYRLIKQK